MAGNFVEILVKSRDEAKPDLDELKAKLEELGHEVARARAEVDDAGAAAKLDRLQAKLLELDRKTANPKIRMTGALRAEAEIHMVEASLDNLNRKEDEAAVKTGLLGSAFDLLGKKASLPMLPEMPIAALVPLLAAAATEATALATGFAAAGAGAAAFAVLAMPAVKSVESAYSGLHAAQQKYAKAVALDKLDPTKAHAAAVKSAADQLKLAHQEIGKLPASGQQAISGLSKLRSEFGKMAKAFEPTAFKVFADGLKVVGDLLPHLTQFATPFASAFDGLLKQLDKFVTSKGFNDFMSQMASLVGPATTAIGQGIGQVVVAFGKLFTIMSKKDVINGINIAFKIAAGAITVFGAAVKTAMAIWDGLTRALHDAAHNFDVLRHANAAIGHSIAHEFDVARHAVASFAHDIASAFDHVRHDIAAKFDGVRHAIASKFDGARHWLADKAHDIANAFDHVRHDIAAKFDGARHWIAAKFDGAISWLLQVGKDIIQGLINGLEAKIPGLKSVVRTVVGLLKDIGHAVGVKSPSTLMHFYGVNIMQGLINGMQSRMPDLRAQVGGVVGLLNTMGSNPAGINGRGGLVNPSLQLQVVPGGGGAFEQFLVMSIRNYVRVRGGNVQQAFGH